MRTRQSNCGTQLKRLPLLSSEPGGVRRKTIAQPLTSLQTPFYIKGEKYRLFFYQFNAIMSNKKIKYL